MRNHISFESPQLFAFIVGVMGNTRSLSLDSIPSKPHHERRTPSNPSSSSDGKCSSPSSAKRKRLNSSDSVSDYGWYEDFESQSAYNSFASDYSQKPLHRALTLPAPANEPPMYVLESSLETQQLWYSTAGRRPAQPEHERNYFEQMWSQNFESSEINYGALEQQQQQSSPSKSPARRTDTDLEVMYRGKSPFSNSVSKSFTNQAVPSMTIQLPYFRIVRDKHGVLFAEYLIMVSLGGRGSVAFGIWKRHSDFDRLAKTLADVDIRGLAPPHSFKNSLLSWQCVLQRKRWFKSLDTEYLALKCFLIERFMQDLLFETHSAGILVDFLGLR